jgi:hypothetical protein
VGVNAIVNTGFSQEKCGGILSRSGLFNFKNELIWLI